MRKQLPLPVLPSGHAAWHGYRSGWGRVVFALTDQGLLATQIAMNDFPGVPTGFQARGSLSKMTLVPLSDPIAESWETVLQQIFKGARIPIQRIPFDDRHWTDFRKRVYQALMDRVPVGKVITYGGLANIIGSARFSRAVGQAMSSNPVAPFVPCHRVISSDLNLHAYSAGGGLELKKALLQSEGVRFNSDGTVKPQCCLAF